MAAFSCQSQQDLDALTKSVEHAGMANVVKGLGKVLLPTVSNLFRDLSFSLNVSALLLLVYSWIILLIRLFLFCIFLFPFSFLFLFS